MRRGIPALAAVVYLAWPQAGAAAPLRRWEQVAGAPLGASLPRLKQTLGRTRLRSVRVRGRGVKAWRERVRFEGHTPARVTYRFYRDRLYEVEVWYLRRRRLHRVRSFLRRKYGKERRVRRVRVYQAQDREVRFYTRRGRVVLEFVSPGIVREMREARKKRKRKKRKKRKRKKRKKRKRKKRKKRKRKKRKRHKRKAKKRKKVGPVGVPEAPRRVVRTRGEDPALWEILGVRRGPVTIFSPAPLPGRRGGWLVAAGFTRAAGRPLAAILSRGPQGYRLHYLGTICRGVPKNAQLVDFRFDGGADAVLYLEDFGRPRAALIPFDARYAGARFVGGRWGGRNVYGCYRLGKETERIDFADVDRDRSSELLLSRRIEHGGPAYDVYFYQGADFYFRETRRGRPPRHP